MNNKQTIHTFRDALLDILYYGNGTKDLLALAETHLKKPIFLFDINFNSIAVSPGGMKHREHMQTTSQNTYLNEKEIGRMKEHNVFEDIAAHSSAFTAKDKDMKDMFWLLCAVRIKDTFIGYVISPFPDSEPEPFALDLMTELARALSVELQKSNVFSYETGLKYSYFLTNLINGDFENEDVIRSRMEILQRAPLPVHYILCISSDRSPGANTFHPSVLRQVRSCFRNCISTVYQGNMVLLTGNKIPLTFDKSQRDLMSFLITHRLHCGVSQEFHDLVSAPLHYQEALGALSIGMHKEPGIWIHLSEELLFDQLLSHVEKDFLPVFCYRPYIELKEYDRIHHTEYLTTLKEYLRCAANSTKAAQKLNLHRTTLFYRLKNMEDLFRISFSDADTLFRLACSVRIDQFLNIR